MESTIDRVKTSAREQNWNDFLSGLPPWEFHSFLKGELELIMHDSYVAGECTLHDVRTVLSVSLADPDYDFDQQV